MLVCVLVTILRYIKNYNMKQKTIYSIASVLSFSVAGLLITGNTGLEIQPLNEAACFSVAGMMGFLFLFAAVTKDQK